jgi:hypothetical protein
MVEISKSKDFKELQVNLLQCLLNWVLIDRVHSNCEIRVHPLSILIISNYLTVYLRLNYNMVFSKL